MTELHAYLKGLAESNTDIAHVDDTHVTFKRNRMEELKGNMGLELNSFCMFYFNYEGGIVGPNMDQLYDRKKVTIVICRSYNYGDFEDLDNVQDACLEVAKQIHAKIMLDYSNGELTKLNHNIEYYKYHNAPDKIAACAFDVDIDFINDVKYDPAKWQ